MSRKSVVIAALAVVIAGSFALVSKAEETAKAPLKAEGVVSSVDADGKHLVVKTVDGADIEVTWNDKTQLGWQPEIKDAAPPTASDLTLSTKVIVTYAPGPDGKMVASEIWVHPAE